MEVPEAVDAEAIKQENRELKERIRDLENKIVTTEQEVSWW
jgi:hypothetical protein